MKKHFKILIALLCAVLVFLAGVFTTVYAQNLVFTSQGRIESQSVVIDSKDFTTILNAFEQGKIESYNQGVQEGLSKGIEVVKAAPKEYGVATARLLCSLPGGKTTVDVKTYCDNWEFLTSEDFIIELTGSYFYMHGGRQINAYFAWENYKKEYDPSTGIISIETPQSHTAGWDDGSTRLYVGASCSLWVIG